MPLYVYKFRERNRTSSRPDDDVVNRDEDELHEKPYESHHYEANRRTKRHLREFWASDQKMESIITRI